MSASATLRECSTCGVSKPETVEHFYAHKPSRGGLTASCKACRQEKIRAYNASEAGIQARAVSVARRRSNGSAAESSRTYREKNSDKCRSYEVAWRKRNAERVRAVGKRWREANPEKVREKQRRADAKLQQNPEHVLKKRIKARVRALLKGGSSREIERALGYTRADLVAHIQRQFAVGMAWEALMRGDIHIDHIIPVSRFRFDSIEDPEFRACWALSNLQPLWATDNQRKQAKVLTLL